MGLPWWLRGLIRTRTLLRFLPTSPAFAPLGLVAGFIASGAALSLALGCEPDQEVRQTWESYRGEAPFPNRRPAITLPTSGEVGIVSNSLSDTLTFLSLPDARVIATVPVGREPVDIDGPHHLALDRAQGFLVTALSYPPPAIGSGPHGAHGASDRFGYVQKLALGDLRLLGEVRVDPNPGDVVMSGDGKRVVVTHYDVNRALSGKTLDEQRATVMVIDSSTLVAPPARSPEPKAAKVCVAPHGVALSPDANRAFVACYGEDSLAVVDLGAADLSTTRIVLEGGTSQPGASKLGPYSATLSPDGSTVAVGCLLSKEVKLFDVVSGAFRPGSWPVQGAALFGAWSSDGKTFVVPVQTPDALVVFDVATGSLIKQRALAGECEKPHEVTRSLSGTEIYVVCEGNRVTNGAVLVVDAQTLETKARADVGVYPDRLVVSGTP